MEEDGNVHAFVVPESRDDLTFSWGGGYNIN